MPRHLTLYENALGESCSLSDSEADVLNRSTLARAVRSAEPGVWEVSADRKIGVLSIGLDLQVTVLPKVEINRLLFMLGYARTPDFWRDQPVAMPRHAELPEALADTFRRTASAALERGLLHGYRTVEDSLSVVRGRIRTDDQLRLRYDQPLPVEVRYEDFTSDIAENQILLAAVLRLLVAPRVSTEARAGLHRLRRQLSDITPPTGQGMRLPSWRPSRLNAHYVAALRLAELVIAASSFELHGGEHRVDVHGFVLDAWRIFEDFVCVALDEAMRRTGGNAKFQHRGHLDEAGRLAIEPDFTWWADGRAVAVVDAKYKAEKSARFPNADTYQVLAYCIALNLTDGHLVYAKGETEPSAYRVAGSTITLHSHALDLAVDPPQLLEQIANLAAHVQGAVPTAPPPGVERPAIYQSAGAYDQP